MNHIFKCGIAATSNGPGGDKFLSLMMDDAPMKKLERNFIEFEMMKREQRASHRLVASMVKAAGGEVFVSDIDLLAEEREFICYRDEYRRGIVVRLKEVDPHCAAHQEGGT